MVREQIFRARAISTYALLVRVGNQEHENKITFNTTYHLVFCDVN